MNLSDLNYLERRHIERLSALIDVHPHRYVATSILPTRERGSAVRFRARIVTEDGVEFEAFGRNLLEALVHLSELSQCVLDIDTPEPAEIERMLELDPDTQPGGES